ncbi:hypothetical protein BJ878DRAFT_480450 [Calycina marina]|uniref:NB-ARC domain-containing protein n=1 Tax=Calycina marina TaxID=1763456 RepID=A0A9P7Z211_9HELO|nr:hypothetical protein BJ878DRAFT_480450 [Calycina marina]
MSLSQYHLGSRFESKKIKDDDAHALNTWTEIGRLWPRDDLPKKLPDTRISLYIYDSSAVYGGSQATFADKANELLETIRCDREDWTGLAFFGTPHEGGSQGMVNAERIAANVALSQFENYRMASFWGDKDTIVSRDSSRFRLPGGREKIIELKANHRRVAAFGQTTKDEGNLKKVISNVKSLYKEALKEITPRIKWIVPFEKNSCFTGRESELTRLEELLFAEGGPKKLVVFGLGGIGKTGLTIELVYRIKEHHKDCSIFWIPATNF